MNYSDYFSINRNFQSSVNLELDLNKEEKIREYIPTSDICDVLKKFVKSVLGYSKDKATTLIGPYGKGKSFLLLVLFYILSNNKNSETWNELANKIRSVDVELYDLLLEIKKKDINLLPVIINSNYDNIIQSFQLSLNEALKRESLDEIIPESAFDICIQLLEKWQKQDSIKNEVFLKCKELTGLNLTKLKKELRNYSQLAYKQFVDLYNCVNIGLEFNPLVNNDIVKIYSDVSFQLIKHDYNGIFIVFDEFSKFLESNSTSIMKDLKIIQDFAEMCARSSKESQIHLCCVTHKNLGLYSQKTNVDSFKTVEGRFKEIRFNRSLEENYQIISSAIRKKPTSEKIVSDFGIANKDFYHQITELGLFSNDLSEQTVFNDCFPLNPLTVYSLIHISEYAAQNERTLFTFLADTDDDSFNSFIHNNDSGLLNVDKIYDYFSPLLQSEKTNLIRNIWYRTESILSKLDNKLERRIIKSISILLMINDLGTLPSTEKVIALTLNADEKEVSKLVSSLIERHYLRRNVLNNLLSFALYNSKEIDESIELLKKTKFKNLRYGEVLDSITEHKFILPRQYNEVNKITRFYRIQFMSEQDFTNIKSFNYFFETELSDGLIVYLLRDKLTNEEIKNKILTINDQRVIYKFPNEKIQNVFYDSISRFACLNECKKQKGLDDITLNEIDLLIQETITDVRTLIDKYFIDNCTFYSSFNITEKNFNKLLSDVMSEIYSVKLVFNNELINKHNVSSQYQKAINHVIDWLLEGEDEFNYSDTSPESTIKKSIIDNNMINIEQNNSSGANFKKIIESIKDLITSSPGRKIVIKQILEPFTLPPYGIRKGVLPVLIAKAISELTDNIVLYYSNKEIDINAVDLVKSISNDNYQIYFSKSSADQRNYLNKLIKLLHIKSTNNFRKDTVLVCNSLKKIFIGMPQIIRLATLKNNFIGMDEHFINFKNIYLSFNVNPFEAVYDTPKRIFETSKYSVIYTEIESIINNKDSLLINYKNNIISKIRSIYDFDSSSSLKSEFTDFIKKHVKDEQKPILEQRQKDIFNLIISDFSYDNLEAVNMLAKTCCGGYIEDWDNDKTKLLLDSLSLFKSIIETTKKVNSDDSGIISILNNDVELSSMAMLLKNNVESVLDEFSGSVSSNDKLAVLATLMKDLL